MCVLVCLCVRACVCVCAYECVRPCVSVCVLALVRAFFTFHSETITNNVTHNCAWDERQPAMVHVLVTGVLRVGCRRNGPRNNGQTEKDSKTLRSQDTVRSMQSDVLPCVHDE